MSDRAFDAIILLGRPAAGKSEVIDFLKSVPLEERLERFHIGEFQEIDDFPYIWDAFETDDIMTRHGKPRLFTDRNRFFLDDFLWDFFIEKLNNDYRKLMAEKPDFYEDKTLIVEFSRGGQDGFRRALRTLDPDILQRAGILYIKVSYEESVRKNERRARPGQEHSILHHSLEPEKMKAYYRINDWEQIEQADPDFVEGADSIRVPYVAFDNEPEKTHDTEQLGAHLEEICQRLWQLKTGE